MGMPPAMAYKQLHKQICEMGYEIQINQCDRYCDKFSPPGITSNYEVLRWENGKPIKEAYFHKKLDLYYWLLGKVKELSK